MLFVDSFRTRNSAGGSPLISPSLVASRTSGPAPLAVHFSAVESLVAGWDQGTVFRRCLFSFDYGDPGSGTWAYGNAANNSKNADVGGPLGGHVFTNPGAYTVTLWVDDLLGNTNSTTVTITVTDPDTVYAGAGTICVNDTGTNDGLGPAGATYQSTMPSAATMNDKRVLLRRGSSTERAIPGIANGSGHAFYIGAYGSGAAPLIAGGDIVFYNQRHSVLMDCAPAKNTKFNVQGGHFLFLRCQHRAFSGAPTTDLPYGAGSTDLGYTNTGYLSVVECTVDANDIAASYCFFGPVGPRSMFLGNNFRNPGYHDLRATNSWQMLVAHNSNEGSAVQAGYHALKAHSAGTAAFSDGAGGTAFASRYLVIANNQFGRAGSINGYLVEVSPQNNGAAEGIEDVILENNVFGTDGTASMALGGRRITYINNTKLAGGAATVNTGVNMGGVPAWDGPYYTSRS